MNTCQFIGRLTKDVDLRQTQDGSLTVARFGIAVDRKFKNNQGKYDADFLNIVAFGKQAEFADKHLRKGMKIGIVSHVQTGSYTNKDGQKVYTTDFIADEFTFCESMGTVNNANDVNEGFMAIPESVDDGGLPFN